MIFRILPNGHPSSDQVAIHRRSWVFDSFLGNCSSGWFKLLPLISFNTIHIMLYVMYISISLSIYIYVLWTIYSGFDTPGWNILEHRSSWWKSDWVKLGRHPAELFDEESCSSRGGSLPVIGDRKESGGEPIFRDVPDVCALYVKYIIYML